MINKMNSPIKILQIGMTSNIGGLETYLMEQFNNIDKSKVHYDFVNITGEYEIVYKDEILSAGSKIYNIQSRHTNPIKHYWQWCRLLSKVAREYKAIVLNSNSLVYIFPLFAARLFSIPMRIIHSHNAGFEVKNSKLRSMVIAMNRILMNYSATDYFACSEKAGQWMFQGKKKFSCIHNAIDTTPYIFNKTVREQKRMELGLSNELVIGHVGRFSYQKNHEKVIEIFNTLHKKQSNSTLLLIGGGIDSEGTIAEVKQQVNEYGIEYAVKFLGMRSDVPQLMQAMDAFILPSRFEGLGLVGIEAQAAGLPCFFSDTITRELEVTDLCHFIELGASSEVWAQTILDEVGIQRKDMSKAIATAGYDIKTEIKKLEAFYQK